MQESKEKQPTLKWLVIAALGATAAVCAYFAAFVETPKDPTVKSYQQHDTADVPQEVASDVTRGIVTVGDITTTHGGNSPEEIVTKMEDLVKEPSPSTKERTPQDF